jgi:hypothetical protein
MQAEINPYEASLAAGGDSPADGLRRPAMGTVLLGLWLVEGGVKACIVAMGLASGFNPLESLVEVYPSWNRFWLFLALSFFMVETIGPWIGIYYLTGRRARTFPFDAALQRILGGALGVGSVATLLLMLYCELYVVFTK